MKKTKNRGSMLAVTMIILGIVLFVSLSVSLVSMRERRASIGSGKSNSAFQTADTGVEKVMAEIMSGSKTTTDQLTGCRDSGLINEDDGYEVQLKGGDTNGDGENDPINCKDRKPISDIVAIKSVGQDSGNNQQRAIEAAVAGNGEGDYQVTFSYGSPNNAETSSFQALLYCKTKISTGEVKCVVESSSNPLRTSPWEASSKVGDGKKYNTECIVKAPAPADGSVLCCREEFMTGLRECKKSDLFKTEHGVPHLEIKWSIIHSMKMVVVENF